MPNLHEINERLRDLLENGYDETCINMETGEFDADRAHALVEELSIERNEKIDGIALYIEELDINASALKAKADELLKRSRSSESKAQRLKEYLAAELNGEKYESESVKITYRKTSSVVVDEKILPAEYFAEKVERKPDKSAIKEAIMSGVVIPGARISVEKRIQIK